MRGLLCTRTAAMEWLVPRREEVPMLSDGYVVSFVPFLERRLMMPPHQFL
jgi:hypothetical protein